MKTYQEWTKPQNNWMSEINQLGFIHKDGQSMIRIQFKEVLWNGVWKIKGLKPRFLIWKEVTMFAQYFSGLD